MLIAAKIVAISFVLMLISSVQAEHDWEGTYVDPTYGGSLTVCVSQIGGVNYGQGLISSVGYLRGTIDSSNVWTGNFFLAGNAAIGGTFTLTLDIITNSYSGTYQQSTGTDVIYSVTNAARTSFAIPSDEECFKADDSMLTMTTSYDITSAIDGDFYSSYWYLSAIGTSLTSSYEIVNADGSKSPGTTYGTTFLNGQLILDNWYESGADQGIQLTLAKNSTHIYTFWWFVSSIAEFDYTTKNAETYEMQLLAADTSVPTTEIVAQSTSNVCYTLSTQSAEESCTSTTTVVSQSSDEDFDDFDRSLLSAAVAFSVLTFLTVVAILIITLVRPSSPEASKEIPMSTRGDAATTA